MATKMDQMQRIGLMLVISILFTDELLYSIIIPITPYFAEQLGMSPTMTGILFSSYAVASLIALPFFGALADKVGPRMPILIGLAIIVLSTLLFAFSHSYMLLVTARSIQGIAAGATWATALAYLADLFPSTLRGRAMGMALTGISTGTLLGAPIGGFIFEFGGYQWPFLFVASLAVLNIIFVFVFIPKGAVKKQTKKTHMLSLLQNRSILFVVTVIFTAATTLCLLDPVLPMLFDERFGMSSAMIGILFGIMTLANALIAPIAGSLSDKYHPRFIMLIGLTGMAVALPGIAFSQTFWQAACAMIFAGLGIGFSVSPAMSHLGNIVEKSNGNKGHGKAYALSDMCFTIGMVMGPLIGGIITDVLSVVTVLVMSGVVIFFYALMLFTTVIRQGKVTSTSFKN